MASSEQFKHYTEKVCAQIRWKKAHGVVAQEIENHLIDQKNAYMDMGDSESTAEEKALLQMGDPVAVGAALDGTHKPAPQWGMMGLVMVLFAIGACIHFLFLEEETECIRLYTENGVPARLTKWSGRNILQLF